MTSLRTFQNEMDEIHHREVLKKRLIAHAQELAEKEKDSKNRREKEPTKVLVQATECPEPAPTAVVAAPVEDEAELSAAEGRIQVC